MLRTKSSKVNIRNLNSRLLQFAEDMSNKFDGIVITSANDSIHMAGSRHYINKALDFGAFSSDKKAYADFKNYVLSNSEQLKKQYNLEDILDEITHIHIEMPLTDIEEVEVKTTKKNVVFGIALIGISLGIVYFIIKKTKTK